MFLRILIFLSVFGNIHPACIDNNGNENQCKAELCHWCPCSNLCVPERYACSCDSECAGLYNDVEECAARGCIYHPGEKKCYDVDVDTTVDYRAVCGQWNTNSNECTKNGCRHCPCSKLCSPPLDGLKCDAGCYQYCNQADECAPRGCAYVDGRCHPWQDGQIAKNFRYAANVCHNGTTFINGYNYLPTDYTKIRPNKLNPHSFCICDASYVNNYPDKILYECEYASPDMDVFIPVREAGSYEIGMHFAEILQPVGRMQSVRLNGVMIAPNIKIDSYGGRGTRILITRTLSVNCNITEVTVMGETRPIVDRLLVLNLVWYVPSNPNWIGHAVLSAYYLRKLDK
ncbi:unnamed protein product [Orchesella dallaii]|uniref:Malectin domain-containing protein n=1 Tax=Orchesella dallaii TaxID=48710 RepID=A0ABP1RLI0_9HEXA